MDSVPSNVAAVNVGSITPCDSANFIDLFQGGPCVPCMIRNCVFCERVYECNISQNSKTGTSTREDAVSIVCLLIVRRAEAWKRRSAPLIWLNLIGRSFLDGMYVPEGIWLAPCLYAMVAGVRKLAKQVRSDWSTLCPLECRHDASRDKQRWCCAARASDVLYSYSVVIVNILK